MTGLTKRNARVCGNIVFHGLALTAAALFIGTFKLQQMCNEDARVHLLGQTFILHNNGYVVVRTPSDRLIEVTYFMQVRPEWIWLPTAIYLMLWFVTSCAILLARKINRQRPEPRGFPLD